MGTICTPLLAGEHFTRKNVQRVVNADPVLENYLEPKHRKAVPCPQSAAISKYHPYFATAAVPLNRKFQVRTAICSFLKTR